MDQRNISISPEQIEALIAEQRYSNYLAERAERRANRLGWGWAICSAALLNTLGWQLLASSDNEYAQIVTSSVSDGTKYISDSIYNYIVSGTTPSVPTFAQRKFNPQPRFTGVDYRLVQIIERAEALAGYKFEVRECLRSQDRQEQLVKEGFSWTTNSYHKTGHACDIGMKGVDPMDNKLSWEWAHVINKHMQSAAAQLNLEVVWGGDWKKTPDGFHWQVARNNFVRQPVPMAKPKKQACLEPIVPTNKELVNYVECVGKVHGLPPGYMASLAYVESRFNTRAMANGTSDGAVGLYQFIPATATWMGVNDRFDVSDSTYGAAKYSVRLQQALPVGHKPVNIYMAYNQGYCGYTIIQQIADHGSSNYQCAGKVLDADRLYQNILGNTAGGYQKIIRQQGKLNTTSALAYINFMTNTYWPKGEAAWKQHTGR